MSTVGKERCVACGKPMELSEAGNYDHHCDEKVVQMRNTIMARGREHQTNRTWAQRLCEGMAMLRLS